MISEKEWTALPEEERQRRCKEFEARLRGILDSYDKDVIKAALTSTIATLKDK